MTTKFGTVDIDVTVDSGRVLDVTNALAMLCVLLSETYGHTWTDKEAAVLSAASAACEIDNLSFEAKP